MTVLLPSVRRRSPVRRAPTTDLERKWIKGENGGCGGGGGGGGGGAPWLLWSLSVEVHPHVPSVSNAIYALGQPVHLPFFYGKGGWHRNFFFYIERLSLLRAPNVWRLSNPNGCEDVFLNEDGSGGGGVLFCSQQTETNQEDTLPSMHFPRRSVSVPVMSSHITIFLSPLCFDIVGVC